MEKEKNWKKRFLFVGGFVSGGVGREGMKAVYSDVIDVRVCLLGCLCFV